MGCTASPAGMCVTDRPRPVSLRMRRLRGDARETRRQELSSAIFKRPTKRAHTNALEATKVGCMATGMCDWVRGSLCSRGFLKDMWPGDCII